MNDRAMRLIDQYLERVRTYLPMEDEEYLLELRTHLIQEAERIGDGEITPGSALMAIERMGEPQAVANEYAGTGKRVGPVPVEYLRPLIALLFVLASAGLALVLGTLVAAQVLPDVLPVSGPLIISWIVVLCVLAVLSILEQRHIIEVQTNTADRTLFERVLAIGREGLRRKTRTSAVMDVVGGVVISALLLHPRLQVMLTPVFLVFVPYLVAILLAQASVGLVFLWAGENTTSLIVEGAVGIAQALLASVLIHIGWPTRYVYLYQNGVWTLVDLTALLATAGPGPDVLLWKWVFVISVVVAASSWRAIVDLAKALWYLREGRGLWWRRLNNGPNVAL